MATSTSTTNSLFCETPGFQPFITGKEICASLKTVSLHIEAIIPKERNALEVIFKSEEIAIEFGVKLVRRETGFWKLGSVLSRPHHVMWRGTSIKTRGTGDLRSNYKEKSPNFSPLLVEKQLGRQ